MGDGEDARCLKNDANVSDFGNQGEHGHGAWRLQRLRAALGNESVWCAKFLPKVPSVRC